MEVDGMMLRAERERQRLSLSELAALSGVNRVTILHIEQGKRPNAHPRTLRRIEEALGLRERLPAERDKGDGNA